MIKGVILNAENPHVEDVTGIGATWLHDGGPQPIIYPGIESVPGLQWGRETDAPGGNSRYLFVWNEPNHTGLSPEDGAIAWRENVEPRWANARLLLCPGCSWRSGWIEAWWNAYRAKYGRNPGFSAINIHGYDYPGRDVLAEFRGALAFATAKHRSLWITEYAALPFDSWTETERLTRAWSVIGWAMLNGVARFAWFNTRTRGDERWAMDYNAPLFEYDSGAGTASGRLYAAWNGG